MASEAQRLIGISLTKIAQSRTHRGGVSLHKNLLVATVLQKARYIFMEEAYNMVHYQQQQQPPAAAPAHPQQQVPSGHGGHAHQQPEDTDDDDERIGLTVEEAGIDDYQGCIKCASNHHQQQQQQQIKNNKENQPPAQEATYLDLDSKPSAEKSVLKERQHTLKRRRAVSEWETEEAVQSILPKRKCPNATATISPEDDNVFLDDATALSETVAKELELEEQPNNAMEIDRITSLVSIFSFGMAGERENKLANCASRVTAPDLCSSQAKEGDAIQQRPFLAMAV